MKKSIYFFKTLFLAVLFSSGLSLMAQTLEIELQQPTGGEHWTGGGTYLISWLDNFSGTVDALYGTDQLVTKNTLNDYLFTGTEDMEVALQSEYPDYVMVDWDDLTAMTEPQIDTWINNLGLVDQDIFWIVKDGNPLYPGDMHYRVKYCEPGGAGGFLALETLYSKLSLGAVANGTHAILGQHVELVYTMFAEGVSGSTTYWNTNGLALGSYVIKVRSHNVPNDDTYSNVSGYFQLVYAEDGEIEVFQPNGGESWALGSKHLISWTDNLNEPVDIYLFDDDEVTPIATIATGIEGSTYEWYIDGGIFNAGIDYKVKVASSVSGATTDPDFSDVKFTLTEGSGGNIEILQPNNTITPIIWAKNSEHLISWNDEVAETVNVFLVPSGGNAAVGNRIGFEIVGTTMVYDFSTTTAGDYFIEVQSSINASERGFGADFTIAESAGGTIEVLQPNDNTIKWWKNSTQLISWNDDLPEAVNVYLVPQGQTVGSAGIPIKLGALGTTTTFNFTGIADGFYFVEVQSSLDANVSSPGDLFELTASSGNNPVVIQPDIAGIKWQRGTSHLISWTDDLLEPVDVWVMKGGSGHLQIGNDVIGSTLVWDIDIAEAIAADYTIEVRSSLDAGVKGVSSNAFEIVGSVGTYINILQPNGGEVWSNNQSYYISWDDDFLEGVDIYLDRVDPAEHVLIKANAIGSTWVWPITGIDTDTDYKIYIESVNDASINDDSDGTFTILPFVLLNAYPNPANNMFTLEVGDGTGTQYQVTMYDRFNTEVYNTTVNSGGINQVSISTQDLPNGVYFLNVSSNTYNASRKIIVNHR